jgi:hypothetical protein
MAKKLQAFLGQYTDTQPNLNAADDDQRDFFFKVRAGNNGSYCMTAKTDGLCPDNYFRYMWEVPAETTKATFHLWGGGGMGAGSFCCMQGLGGGSSAYAYKTVDVTPGDVYTLCFDGVERHCCTNIFCDDGTTVKTDAADPGFVSRGTRGMKAYVLGTGLNNFCTEGGNPGASVCEGWATPRGQTYGGTTCFACVTVTMTCLLGRSTTDSANDVFAPATYYGADGGSKGIYACHQTSCCGATGGMDAARCGDKSFYPYPGGLLKVPMLGHIEKPSVNGGLVATKWCDITGGPHGYAACMSSTYSGYAPGAGPDQRAIGMGGPTPNTCGGTCCCGGRGGPGMIRISYS